MAAGQDNFAYVQISRALDQDHLGLIRTSTLDS
jgi:hypothetical protein